MAGRFSRRLCAGAPANRVRVVDGKTGKRELMDVGCGAYQLQ
jgi:hypothetical protein